MMKITITLTNSETKEVLTVQEASAEDDTIEELQSEIVDALQNGDYDIVPKP